MRFTKGLLAGLIISALLHLWIFGWGEWSHALRDKWQEVSGSYSFIENTSPPIQEVVPVKKMPEIDLSKQESADFSNGKDAIELAENSIEGISIGMSQEEVKERLGEPVRVEPSAYGYQWWVYNEEWIQYIQIGIADGKVVTLYTNAPQWSWSDLAPGMPASEWKRHWNSKKELSFHYDLGFYTFTLSETDLKERPLYIDGKTAIQLYIDVHDQGKLSAMRVMDLKTLLLHRPYGLKYIGKLPESPDLTEEEWERISVASERQILDIVNVTRKWYQLPPFEWHNDASIVARGHSQDMNDHEFFDHYSPKQGDLGDRLDKIPVRYQSAGENIAWNYVDGPDAHEGWLNSLGHRKNVMQADFSHLGIGVVQKYYTQNFITP